MIKQLLLNSVIAKYRDLRDIDKSRYFAQPRPIIANYSLPEPAQHHDDLANF